MVATKPLPARAPLSSRACASGERREAAGHTGPASGGSRLVSTVLPAQTRSGRRRPCSVQMWWAGPRHHWQFIPATLCKSKQNKTNPQKNTVVLSPHRMKTPLPPISSPHLFPPPPPLGRRGPRQGPWLWLSARPWPWPGLEATRGRGARSRRPSVALGKVRFVLRAHLTSRGRTGGLGAEGIGVGVGLAPGAMPGTTTAGDSPLCLWGTHLRIF